MYLVFTRMPCESYRRQLRSWWLCLCEDFRVLINSLVLLIFQSLGSGLVLELGYGYAYGYTVL